MQRRRNITKKQKKGKLFIAFVVIVMFVAISIGKSHLVKQSQALSEKQVQLQEQIDDAKEDKEQLAQREKYMKTDDYVEDVARDKLGMSKKNEIIFKPSGK